MSGLRHPCFRPKLWLLMMRSHRTPQAGSSRSHGHAFLQDTGTNDFALPYQMQGFANSLRAELSAHLKTARRFSCDRTQKITVRDFHLGRDHRLRTIALHITPSPFESGDFPVDRRLTRIIEDHFVARYFASAFAGGALIAFRAGADPNAGRALFHFEYSHPDSIEAPPNAVCSILRTFFRFAAANRFNPSGFDLPHPPLRPLPRPAFCRAKPR